MSAGNPACREIRKEFDRRLALYTRTITFAVIFRSSVAFIEIFSPSVRALLQFCTYEYIIIFGSCVLCCEQNLRAKVPMRGRDSVVQVNLFFYLHKDGLRARYEQIT